MLNAMTIKQNLFFSNWYHFPLMLLICFAKSTCNGADTAISYAQHSPHFQNLFQRPFKEHLFAQIWDHINILIFLWPMPNLLKMGVCYLSQIDISRTTSSVLLKSDWPFHNNFEGRDHVSNDNIKITEPRVNACNITPKQI